MSNRLPINAGELINSPYVVTDAFALLYHVEKVLGITTARLDPNFPLAVKTPDMQDQVRKERGLLLPTLAEFNDAARTRESLGVWGGFHSLVSGPALWITTEDRQEPRLLLLQKAEDAPQDALKWSFPSSPGNSPFETTFTALHWGAAILFQTNGGELVGINFRLPGTMPELDGNFTKAVTRSGYKHKDDAIQAQLKGRDPQLAGKPIRWITVPTREMPDSGEMITISALGNSCEVNAHFSCNDETRRVNMHLPLLADLAGRFMRDVNFSNPIVVASQPGYREAGLFTLKEVRRMAARNAENSESAMTPVSAMPFRGPPPIPKK